ncbi:helix-turn-helix domain-containing protein [Arthrobacter sp. Bi26]|uniref:helix-turn-helix domain-containing protein n=1 Tax=Arthrobacter sp. Bi26 TaxID=2822350 RepID=UPI00339E6CA1
MSRPLARLSVLAIALELGRSPSTVRREIRRGQPSALERSPATRSCGTSSGRGGIGPLVKNTRRDRGDSQLGISM